MLKAAFATADGVHVNEHFGWCRRFDIYEVSAGGFALLESRNLGPAGDDEDGKIDSRLEAVSDCAMLYISAIGGSAAAKVINAQVHPVKVSESEEIAGLLQRLQAVLAGTPPPWMRKLLRVASSEAGRPREEV